MSKIKRPDKVPANIGVNGASVADSSAMQPKKPPPILPPTSSINGASSINGIARANGRPRRDAPPQALGRGQRTAGSKAASGVVDAQSIQPPQPQPYVQTDSYILKKYSGCQPSLIVHLHPTHFRFDQQDGTFSYKSPMKIFIEHLRLRTVPHDLLEYLNNWNTQFYEGCLIVEVHNHKTITNPKESSQNSSAGEKTEPVSIHNPTPYLTPSPWVPYPKDQLDGQSRSAAAPDKTGDDGDKPRTAQEKDKENMPAPGQPNKGVAAKARISTVVLHPTQLSQYIDIAIKATTPAENTNKRRESSQYDAPLSANGVRPQTPMLAIPSTPNMAMDPPPAKRQKREKMEIDVKNVYPVESQITLAITAPLFLEPTRDARDTIALFEALSHPDHSEPMPSPMMRKKTVAEMEAEDSAAQIEEQYMLTLDERYSAAAGGAAGADVDGPVGGSSFEPRFEKFKALERIKVEVANNKRAEKAAQAEAAKKQQLEQEAKEKSKQEEVKRNVEEQRQNALRQHQQQQLANQQAQRQALLQRQMQQAQQQKAMQAASAHGHPQSNMGVPNGVPGMNPQQARFMQQNQIAQQAASPVPRNATPQNMSSPMVGQNMGVPMQTSTSSMGGSPPRPGSVVPPASQMSPQMAQAMRPQSSQQSHGGGGTPRLTNGTPNMAHNIPMANQTPRMTQPSPRAGQMAQAQQLNMLANQNLDPHVRAQIMQQQQAQQFAQQRMRMVAAAQAMGASGSPMTPQMAMQQQQLAQAQMQGNNAGMGQTPLGAQYAAQMRMMQQQHAQAAAQGQNVPQNGMNFNMGMGRGAMTPQMIQQAQQQAQIQVQQQGQMGQPNPAQIKQQQMIAHISRQIYTAQLPNLLAQYPGGLPDSIKQQFMQSCQHNAVMKVRAMMQQQQQQARLAQQQQQQAMMGAQGQMGMGNGMGIGMQQGSPQPGQMGMNGMQQMGGMQRPPGM